jgi:hypothetical protein
MNIEEITTKAIWVIIAVMIIGLYLSKRDDDFMEH